MIERVQLSHDTLWAAVFKAPLSLMFFVAPFSAGLLLSPLFTEIISLDEWLYAALNIFIIGMLVYLNALFGSFIFGTTLYFFLNSVKMQNKWIYYLSGFAGGTFFNLLHPWYSQFLGNMDKFPGVEGIPMANIAVSSYPIMFGLMGFAVAWKFWKHLSKAGVINAD